MRPCHGLPQQDSATTGSSTCLSRLCKPIRSTRSPQLRKARPRIHRFGARRRCSEWADGHKPGQHGTHTYELADYGLTAGKGARGVRRLHRHLRCVRLIGPEWRRQEARNRSADTCGDPRRRSRSRSDRRGSGAVHRPGAQQNAVGHPGVLPPLRLEGSAGCGGIPGDGPRRGAAPGAADVEIRAGSCGGSLDRRTAGPRLQSADPLRSTPDVARGAESDVRRARTRRPRLSGSSASARRTTHARKGSGVYSPRSIPR